MNIIYLVLVSYVICRVLAMESGPFDIFLRWRLFLGKLSHLHPLVKFIADIFNCPFCLGFWMAMIIASMSGLGMLEALAIYGGQYFLERMSGYYMSSNNDGE